jgi:trans-aconitate 2-methyltransferase
MSSTWDPTQYERFHAERSQPFFDLLSFVRPKPTMRAVDLGCGTGELTRELHLRLGCASTRGYDLSETMLAKSAPFAGTGLSFERADLAMLQLPERSVDLVFTNAALHWLPDHAELLARLASWLDEGGQLAVQVPANFDHPSHIVASELAREAPFAEVLGSFRHPHGVVSPEAYAQILFDLGFREQKVRLEVYGHLLESRDDVIEWVKGTLLTAYKERLGEAIYPRFLDEYRSRLLPRLREGSPYFYPFKRILFWATLTRARFAQ